jgi:tetratricopeptide (TPR) repeat protein
MAERGAAVCIINAAVIRDLLARTGIKQWWIADHLGVHRKTVSRWVNGAVRGTTRDLAEALAEALGTTLEEITVAGVADRFATVEDHKAAAEVLRQPDILDRLGPTGNWDSVEKLLRTTLVSALSPALRGGILNNLSIASWRQGKIAQAAEYANKAREIGETIEDKTVLLPALLNLANIESWHGRVREALRLYRCCIEDADHLEPRQLAGALSNYASVLAEAGDCPAARPHLRRATEIYRIHGRPMNLSIAHAQTAMILLELRDYSSAATHIAKSLRYAERDEYIRGFHLAALLEAELEGAHGNVPATGRLVERGLRGFSEIGIFEGKNYEIAARALRLIGELEKARELVALGLSAAVDFPMEQAALERERASILIELADKEGARSAVLRAQNLYSKCGADLRVREMDGFL